MIQEGPEISCLIFTRSEPMIQFVIHYFPHSKLHTRVQTSHYRFFIKAGFVVEVLLSILMLIFEEGVELHLFLRLQLVQVLEFKEQGDRGRYISCVGALYLYRL